MKRCRIAVLVGILVCLVASVGCTPVDYDALFNDKAMISGAISGFSSSGEKITETATDITISYKKFSGMKDFYEIRSEGKGDVRIDYDLTIDKGKFKCVLIEPDGGVTTLFDETRQEGISFSTISGTSYIRFVGVDAEFNINMSVQLSGDVQAARKK